MAERIEPHLYRAQPLASSEPTFASREATFASSESTFASREFTFASSEFTFVSSEFSFSHRTNRLLRRTSSASRRAHPFVSRNEPQPVEGLCSIVSKRASGMILCSQANRRPGLHEDDESSIVVCEPEAPPKVTFVRQR